MYFGNPPTLATAGVDVKEAEVDEGPEVDEGAREKRYNYTLPQTHTSKKTTYPLIVSCLNECVAS